VFCAVPDAGDTDLLPRWVPATVAVVGIAVAAVALDSTLPAHEWWGRISLGGYVVALAMTFHPRTRQWWWAWCSVACGLAPLVFLIVARARGWHHVAQSEVDVIESGARRLLHHGTPYQDPAKLSHRAARNNYSYFPYLPLLTVPGLPRAVLGTHWFTDARIYLSLIDISCGWFAWRRLSARSRAVLVAVAASPVVTLLVAAGGHDVFIVSFLLVGFVGVTAGFGISASFSLLAWPMVVPFGFVRRFELRRVALIAAIVAVSSIPILVSPKAAWANLVKFPAGNTPAVSPADAPSLGHLLQKLPGGKAIDLLLLVAIVGVLGMSLLRRPPATVGAAAGRAAIAFTALIVSVPATRTGYLVHPILLGGLAWAASRDARDGAAVVATD
jgi:hypothetical protein